MVEVTELCKEHIPFPEVQIVGVKEAGDEALGWQVAVAGLGKWVEGQICTMETSLICPPTVLHVSPQSTQPAFQRLSAAKLLGYFFSLHISSAPFYDCGNYICEKCV